ncbi:unnamed protein product, partial [Polarella glacialis]
MSGRTPIFIACSGKWGADGGGYYGALAKFVDSSHVCLKMSPDAAQSKDSIWDEQGRAAVAAQDAAQLAKLVQERLAGDATSAAELLQAAAEVATAMAAGTAPPARQIPLAVAAADSGKEQDSAELMMLGGLSLTVPKGRFDLIFTSTGLTLRGLIRGGPGTGGRGAQALRPIPWSDVLHVFKLPKQDGGRKAGAPARTYMLVLALRHPLVVGKQEHQCVVVNADGAKPFSALPPVAEAAECPLRYRLATALEGEEGAMAEHSVLARVFAAAVGFPIAVPEPEVCSLE